MDPLEEYCCKAKGFAPFFSVICGAAHIAGAIFIQFRNVETFYSSQSSCFENFLLLQELFRVEAHQLYTRKPIFDALGFQLFAIIHKHTESEVKDFWPRYWGGAVIFDQGRGFFKGLGGGKLMKDKFLSGFVFNPRAIANYKRAKAMK